MSKFTLSAVCAGLALLGSVAQAASATWTNTADGSSGFWTNGILWGQATAGAYPGANAGETARMTNNAAGAYTNIYNFTLANALTALNISNNLGQAWLVVTQGASEATLTVATMNLNQGARIRIDAGGIISNTAASGAGLKALGNSDATIYLNNNGTLVSSTGLAFGGSTTSSGQKLLVTSTSGAGGVWNFGNAALNIGATAGFSNNQIVVNGGVTMTNINTMTVGLLDPLNGTSLANFNSLYATNLAGFFGSGAITVGAVGNTCMVQATTGVWDGGGQALTVSALPETGGSSSSNLLKIAGGIVMTNFGPFSLAYAPIGRAAPSSISTDNRVWVDGSNTVLGVANGTIGFANYLYNGNKATTSNNVLLVSAGATLISSNMTVGRLAGAIASRNNQLILDQGTWTNWQTITIGVGGGIGNAVIVTNSSKLYAGGLTTLSGVGNQLILSNNSTAYFGGGLTVNGNYNYAYISNAAPVSTLLGQGALTWGTDSGVGNTGVVYGGSWDGGGQALTVGLNFESSVSGSNLLKIAGGMVMTNFGTFTLGEARNRSGSGSTYATNAGNRVWVDGSNTVLGVANGTIGFGNSVWDNSSSSSNQVLLVSAGATLISSNMTFGLTAGRNSASLGNQLILDQGTWTNWQTISIGAGAGNTVIVTNNSTLYVGGLMTLGGSGNQFIVGGASTATVANLVVANNNSVNLLGGQLTVTGVFSNNNTAAMIVGDGTQSATLRLTDPAMTSYFAGGLALTNQAALKADGRITIGSGKLFSVDSGTTTSAVDRLVIQNTSTLAFNSGVLQVTGYLSNQNTAVTTIGNGSQAATLHLTNPAVPSYFAGGLTIANQAALKGAGKLSANVTVQQGGMLEPGNSIGTLTIEGNLTLEDGAVFNYEMGLGTNDLVHVIGNFNVGGSITPLVLNVLALGGAPAATDTNVMFSWTGGYPDNAGTWTLNLPGGWTDANGAADNVILTDYNQLALVGISAIPEPSALTLVGAGLLLLLATRRRHL